MNLSPEQHKVLQKLNIAYQTWEAKHKELELDFKVKSEAAKTGAKRLILEAQEAGIPVRQIHLTMGMRSPVSLEKFLAPVTAGSMLKTLIESQGVSSTTVPEAEGRAPEEGVISRIIDEGRNVYTMLDDLGTEYTGTLYEVAGTKWVEFGVPIDDVPIEVRDEFAKRFPDTIIGSPEV